MWCWKIDGFPNSFVEMNLKLFTYTLSSSGSIEVLATWANITRYSSVIKPIRFPTLPDNTRSSLPIMQPVNRLSIS